MWQKMKHAKIYPVLAGETIQFRQSLEPFESYLIDTKVIGWDDRFMYIEHRYHRHHKTCALAIVKIRMIGQNNTRVSPMAFIQLVDPNREIEPVRNLALVTKWNECMIEHFAAELKE